MYKKRILAAVDILDGRQAAFERALSIAQSSGAELYLLHAVPVNRSFSFRGAERLARMAQLRRRAEDVGVSVQTVEQHGDAAEIIELHANARAVDLIVMGGQPRRGWGGQRSLVAERVVRRANVPTLVVATGAPGSQAAFENVLVAVDLSPASTDVVRGAMELISHNPARLTVMHTVQEVESAAGIQNHARWTVPEYRVHVLGDARRNLEAVASEAPASIETRVQLSTGSAARRILEYAADTNADLVVMGRSRGFKLLGSTALRVLRKNSRALLVIPSAADRAGRSQRLAA